MLLRKYRATILPDCCCFLPFSNLFGTKKGGCSLYKAQKGRPSLAFPISQGKLRWAIAARSKGRLEAARDEIAKNHPQIKACACFRLYCIEQCTPW